MNKGVRATVYIPEKGITSKCDKRIFEIKKETENYFLNSIVKYN